MQPVLLVVVAVARRGQLLRYKRTTAWLGLTSATPGVSLSDLSVPTKLLLMGETNDSLSDFLASRKSGPFGSSQARSASPSVSAPAPSSTSAFLALRGGAGATGRLPHDNRGEEEPSNGEAEAPRRGELLWLAKPEDATLRGEPSMLPYSERWRRSKEAASRDVMREVRLKERPPRTGASRRPLRRGTLARSSRSRVRGLELLSTILAEVVLYQNVCNHFPGLSTIAV